MPSYSVQERDDSGQVTFLYSAGIIKRLAQDPRHKRSLAWRNLLSDVFLPAGYPATVSPDYLRYQIYNAAQAFCSSLAGLLASRAVLQGHGVGNASASATDAILLNVLQDVFSRLTTIASGYLLGTSLYPEAKLFRLLADVLNDAAIALDTLSPHLAHLALSPHYPFLVPAESSYLRVLSLCLSGALRSLCGAVAGGSKAALTMHFASDGERTGDVGDLSAKDGSKETVLALFGMLCGTAVMKYVSSPEATYIVLFSLLFCHLAANVLAVRGVVMYSFNRQRASIAWWSFRASREGKASVLSPRAVAKQEHIFASPTRIRCDGRVRVRCSFAAPFSGIVGGHGDGALSATNVTRLLDAYADENYVLSVGSESSRQVRITVCLKEGHSVQDHLKAWLHACELGAACQAGVPAGADARLGLVLSTLKKIEEDFPRFVAAAREAGWKLEESTLVHGSPRSISVDIEAAEGGRVEGRKDV